MSDIIIGRNPVIEAIRSGRSIDRILIKKGRYEGSMVSVVKEAKKNGIELRETDKAQLDRIAPEKNHQGVIAYASAHEYAEVGDILDAAHSKGEDPFVIICDKITDPHNLGAIIRTANCVGAHGVIIPKRDSATLNETVAKAAAGALEYTPVAKVTNIARTLDELRDSGLWIVAADAEGGEMYNVNMKGAIGLVVGSEGEGIGRLVLEKCDFRARIPMNGDINSLNASVAAGILMYEIYSQRRK